jgi:hypothetical protein
VAALVAEVVFTVGADDTVETAEIHGFIEAVGTTTTSIHRTAVY